MKKSQSKFRKEYDLLDKTINECFYINETEGGYSVLSLEQLSAFYDKIEDGLISYNLLEKDLYKKMKCNKLISGPEAIGNYLESQLLNLITTALLKNSSFEIVTRFKKSLWNDKLKEREHYEQLSELIGINEEIKEEIYDFLQNR